MNGAITCYLPIISYRGKSEDQYYHTTIDIVQIPEQQPTICLRLFGVYPDPATMFANADSQILSTEHINNCFILSFLDPERAKVWANLFKHNHRGFSSIHELFIYKATYFSFNRGLVDLYQKRVYSTKLTLKTASPCGQSNSN